MKIKAKIFQIFMHCIILPVCFGLFAVIALSFFLSYEKAIIFAFLLTVLAIFFQISSFIFSVSSEGEILLLQKLGKVYQFYLQEINIETEIKVKNLIFKDQILKIKTKTSEEEQEFDLSLMSLQEFRELESILKNKK